MHFSTGSRFAHHNASGRESEMKMGCRVGGMRHQQHRRNKLCAIKCRNDALLLSDGISSHADDAFPVLQCHRDIHFPTTNSHTCALTHRHKELLLRHFPKNRARLHNRVCVCAKIHRFLCDLVPLSTFFTAHRNRSATSHIIITCIIFAYHHTIYGIVCIIDNRVEQIAFNGRICEVHHEYIFWSCGG